MRWYLLYAYTLFCIISLSKAAALPLPISANANLDLIAPTATNLSDVFPDLPDDNFGYSAEYHGAALSPLACMMVCVSALRELALLDFTEKYLGNTWIRDDYPQVAISVGNPGDIITVRWAMFTIVLAIRDMTARNQFRTSQFNGSFIGIKVGEVYFFAPNMIEKISVANRTEDAVAQISGAVSTAYHSAATVSINVDGLKVNDNELQATLTFRTKEVHRSDMLMAIISSSAG